jgi:hypothetical protein
MNTFERRNSLLGMEFDRYIREHPEFAERIPDKAQVILLMEGEDEFNEWSTRMGKEQAEKDQPILYVTIKRLGPAHSRIEELSVVAG